MTEYIQNLKKFFIVDREHHKFRQPAFDKFEMAEQWSKQNLSDLERSTERLLFMLKSEKPVVLKDEKIAMLRTVPTLPEIFTEEEFKELRKNHFIHEQGKVCNINPLYSNLIDVGFDAKKAEINHQIEKFTRENKQEEIKFLNACLRILEGIEEFALKYQKEAEKVGNTVVAECFSQIPQKAPRNFLEALQFFRLIHFCLWSSFNYHNTVGRFDQYMYPYFKNDMENGTLDQESALELLEEFFISFNKDSDLYTGMQQGDNGQSMVLGGTDVNDKDCFNELSALCMDASLELHLIDPKINLRVNKDTPLELFEKGTYMTKQGLGFPQYSNDDVVIPALIRWGYDKEDAYNYVVAACWEFIIPGTGMDIPNVDGLSFPQTIVEMTKNLSSCHTFEDCMAEVNRNIVKYTTDICNRVHNIYMEPAPLMSLMMDGCVELGKDISKGNKYNNWGIHGTGLSTAVDSLAAIKKYVYEDQMISKEEMQKCLEQNFEGYDQLYNKLRYSKYKMGNDIDEVDDIAVRLLDYFADSLEGKKNERGGIVRPGTGSAMNYVLQSESLGATPDGRKKGEEFACNYSPSLLARCEGPFSIIKSFTNPHLERVCNGGPLTIELHDTLFRNEDSIRKVAMFVQTFIKLGGHQIQLNAVNRETMIDAKKHPEKYRNLIVRVWGWSGYFVELDDVYQDQIIKRMELDI